MEKHLFDKLKFKTAFCCMASDGNIDHSEIDHLKSMCSESQNFINIKCEAEINILINELNSKGTAFFSQYFETLKQTTLSELEELELIDFAIKIINADLQIDYSEIRFFKVIRKHLKISDEIILIRFPDIEYFLEEDIDSESDLQKVTDQYLRTTSLPKFELIQSLDNIGKS